jgi:hypothetical protein
MRWIMFRATKPVPRGFYRFNSRFFLRSELEEV